MAVGREGGAVERAILEQSLRDLPRLQIDDLNALLDYSLGGTCT